MYLERKHNSEEKGFLKVLCNMKNGTVLLQLLCWTRFYAPELADNAVIDLVASTAVKHVSPSE